MTDIIDRAQALEQRQRDAALRRRVPRPQSGRKDCIDCEVEIPEARRAACPGADRCIDCQEIWEKAS